MAKTWVEGEVVHASDLNDWFEDIEDLKDLAETAKDDAETAQAGAETAQAKAEDAVAHNPTIIDGTWWTWNPTTEEYEDTEVPATGELTVESVGYQQGDSGTTPPTGTWSPTPVSVAKGKYGWTKLTFSDDTVSYSISYMGQDGSGSGDMTKAVYDTNNNGVVDNAEKLNGHADTYFAKATDVPTAEEKASWNSKYTASNASANARGLIKYAQGSFTISANGFTADTTYEDYPFRKAVTVNGCTANHFADVAFDLASATGGNIAPVVQTYSGGFYVYAKAQNEDAITGSYAISYNA